MIDPEIRRARALLVDNNELLRSVAAAQLRDAGVGQVVRATSVKEARLLMERERFDIVLCNREFEGSDDSGQDLLDELRREHLLPHSTVFLMVTAQASYHHVVEAGEAALDALLIRPYSAAALIERLSEARQRKAQLADVLSALDAGEHELALSRAMKRYQARLPFATYCGRLAAELFLTLQRPQDAQRMFENLAAARPSSWARLGIARSQMARTDLSAARNTLLAVLQDEPDNADALEWQGRLLLDQSDLQGAGVACQRAAELTPGCILRVQQAGRLACYQGDSTRALHWLTRAVAMGPQSSLFDAQTFVLLALLKHDLGDAPGVSAAREQLRRHQQRHPIEDRLPCLVHCTAVLEALATGKLQQALQGLQLLADAAKQDHFNLEAAQLLLALLHRVPLEQQLELGVTATVQQLALRFCTSKATTEYLLAHITREEPAAGIVRRCQLQINATAGSALDLSLQGQHGPAVLQLLEAGEQTLNTRLLDMARNLVERQKDKLADAAALMARARQRLHQLSAGKSAGMAGGATGRIRGALTLRSVHLAAGSGLQTPAAAPPVAGAPVQATPAPETAIAPTTATATATAMVSRPISSPAVSALAAVSAPN